MPSQYMGNGGLSQVVGAALGGHCQNSELRKCCQLLCLMSDNAAENVSAKLREFCEERGIKK